MSKKLLTTYNKYKIIIFPLFVGIAAAMLIIFLIIPQISSYLKGEEELRVAKDKLATLEKKSKELQSLSGQDLDEKLTVALSAFPTDREYPSVVGLIQKLAQDEDLNLTVLQIGQTTTTTTRGATPSFIVKFEVTGTRQSIGSMLNSLENSLRIMKISTLDIASRSQETIIANITIESFYGPAPASLGAVDAQLSKISSDEEKLLSKLSAATSVTVSEANLSGIPRGKLNPFE